jgi:hypothetical protein
MGRLETVRSVVLCSCLLLFLPAAAWAQAAQGGSIAGTVKDATGAVLPGVTVEAASPALIEKIRTVVTDDQGNYRVVQLPPGLYSVTFNLPGFGPVKREGLELTTGFTATMNAELRVGTIAETVTVSGASPVVDTHNVQVQNVYSREALDALPTLKALQSYAAITLAARLGTAIDQDVGGNRGEVPGNAGFTVHNNRGGSRMAIDGMLIGSLFGAVSASGKGYFINQLMVEETVIQTDGAGADTEAGGVFMNIVPKSGGNLFTGTIAGSGASPGMQGSNLTDALRARGVATQPKIKKIYDAGIAGGGPIKKDRLWFYAAQRFWGTQNYYASYYNLHPHSLFYTPDPTHQGYTSTPIQDTTGRLTWQISAKHKVAIFQAVQRTGFVRNQDDPAKTPEAGNWQNYPNKVTQGTWSYPATNRLLFEAGATIMRASQNVYAMPGVYLNDIPVIELSRNLNYNARASETGAGLCACDLGAGQRQDFENERFSMSYITGTHAFKTGLFLMQGQTSRHNVFNETPYGPVAFSFRDGRPASIRQWAAPFDTLARLQPNLGIYAQDQWTLRKLTLDVGVRFDHIGAYVPAQKQEANIFVGEREFPRVDKIPNFHDISPRLGAAYDVFGDGKTAIKGSLGKYVNSEGVGIAQALSPALRIVTDATRTWNDVNQDFVPDCDLTNPLQNGSPDVCGQLSNVNLGLPIAATAYADNLLHGWGARTYAWQFGLTLQRELRPGTALNVGYFRTWYNNFTVTANQALGPADFDSYCVTLPSDDRLGATSGSQVCGLYDVKPGRFSVPASNLIQSASNFGEQYDRYNGVDVAINARFGRGGLFSGGVSTGQTVTDNCAVVQSNPQIALNVTGGAGARSSNTFCHVVLPWSAQTQVKVQANYPLPWWGLQASGTYQNLPGIPIFATYVATNAAIVPTLNRNLASCPATGVCTASVTVAAMVPNTQFAPRIKQVDIRLTKIFRFGGTRRVQGMFDAYNLMNASPVLRESVAYGSNGATWRTPSAILGARLFKFGFQFDF